MGLENKALTPIPAGKQMGEFVRIEKIYGGLKRLVRQFEVKAGDRLLPANIDSDVFDEYGLSDAETTATYNFDGQKSDITYENLYLEEQQVVGPGKSGGLPRLRQIYIEAYADELREVDKPIIDTDENGRRTTQRTFIALNTASDAVKNGEIGTTADPDFADNLLSAERQTIGNSVTFIRRTYIQATDELEQVGNDNADKDENDKWRVQRTFIGTTEAPTDPKVVGVANTHTYEGKTLYLSGIQVNETKAAKTVVYIYREAGRRTYSETNGPVLGTKSVTIEYFVSDDGVTPTGKKVSSLEVNVNGVKTIRETWVTGTITGEKFSYETPLRVPVPGVITLTTIAVPEGDIADVQVKSKTSKEVVATIKLEVTTAPPPAVTNPPFNMDNISCSVTYITTRDTYQGDKVLNAGPIIITNPVRTQISTASNREYEGVYLANTSSAGTQSYSPDGTNTNFIYTSANGSGSTTVEDYVETGIVQQKVRPVFTALDGTQYYEVITTEVL